MRAVKPAIKHTSPESLSFVHQYVLALLKICWPNEAALLLLDNHCELLQTFGKQFLNYREILEGIQRNSLIGEFWWDVERIYKSLLYPSNMYTNNLNNLYRVMCLVCTALAIATEFFIKTEISMVMREKRAKTTV